MQNNNLQLMESCLRKARITGELCDSSIVKYRDSVKKFFNLISKEMEDIEISDFEDFILSMRDNGASNSRIANVISAVKWVINNLQLNNMMCKSLDLEKVKKPKIGRRDSAAYLTEKEIGMFLDAIKNDDSKGLLIRKLRFEALAIFLLQTGARIGEVLSIKINDIDRQNMEVNIIGKGSKPRPLFLKEETILAIDKYLSRRTDNQEALFVALNGKSRWEQTDVGRSFRRYKNRSGIRKDFTIHTLRHTYATQLVMRGVPMNTVQYFLGHSNLETTMKYYIGAVEKDRARQFVNDKYFDFMPK